MEQGSSWEDSFSASQEINRILWNRKVHYHIHINSPPIPILNQINQTPCGMFRNIQSFYGEELSAPHPSLNVQDHPLSEITLHICRLFLHPQPVDAPFCCDRDQLITELLPPKVKM